MAVHTNLFFSNYSEPVIITDSHFCIEFMNSPALRLFDLPPKKHDGKSIKTLFPEITDKTLYAIKSSSNDKLLVTLDSKTYFLESVRAEETRVFVLHHFNFAQELIEEYDFFRTMAHQYGDRLLIKNANGNIEPLNKEFEHATGYKLSEIYGKASRASRSGLYSEDFYQRIWLCIHRGTIYNTSALVSNEVPEKPALTASSKTTEPALVSTEILGKLFIQSTFDQISESVFITDIRGVIIYINSAFTQLTGYTAKEIIGQSARLLKSGKHDLALYKELWETILSGNPWKGRLINKKKDGTFYDEKLMISPLTNHGKIEFFAAIQIDITQDIKENEMQIAVEKEMSLLTLMQGINAKFSTLIPPLLENLEPSKVPDETALSIECLQKQLNQTLFQLSIISKEFTLSQHNLSLNTVLLELKKSKLINKNPGVSLNFFLPEDTIWCSGDAELLKLAVSNIIRNAIESIDSRGIVRVWLSDYFNYETSEKMYLIEITDSGEGIPANRIQHIFDPYYTTKKENSSHMGLGLTLAKSITEEHRGFMCVESVVGLGSSVQMHIPSTLKSVSSA